MITSQDMLAPILANPRDDDPRLKYADWLDENDAISEVPCHCAIYTNDTNNPWMGEPGYHPERDPASGRHEGGWTNCKTCNGSFGRTPGFTRLSGIYSKMAELIRVQIALNDRSTTCSCKGTGFTTDYVGLFDCHNGCQELRAREGALLRENWKHYVPYGRDAIVYQCLNLTPRHDTEQWCGFYIWRGLIDTIITTTPVFLKIAPVMFAMHPITRVGLSGYAPLQTFGGMLWGWSSEAFHRPPGSLDVLPYALWDRLGGVRRQYASAEDANQALSDACVRYGRDEANILPTSIE